MAPASVKISRRALLGASAAAAILKTLPAGAQTAPPPLVLDDASRLNAVPVARHWRPSHVTGEAWLDALRAELKAAAAEGRAVSVGAARHSMGGQALARDGVAMTLDVKAGAARLLDLDRSKREDLPGRRRRAMAAGHRGPRSSWLLPGGDAVESRFRGRRHALRQRPRLAGSLRPLRHDGALVSSDARLGGCRHRLADGESRALRASSWEGTASSASSSTSSRP